MSVSVRFITICAPICLRTNECSGAAHLLWRNDFIDVIREPLCRPVPRQPHLLSHTTGAPPGAVAHGTDRGRAGILWRTGPHPKLDWGNFFAGALGIGSLLVRQIEGAGSVSPRQVPRQRWKKSPCSERSPCENQRLARASFMVAFLPFSHGRYCLIKREKR